MDLRKMKRSEDTEQIKVINWAKAAERKYPELHWLHHIPNGGKRNKKEAEKLKAMGVKAGIPDLHLPYARGCYKSLYIEMKFDHNKPTQEQISFMQEMQTEGHYCCICYTAEAAIEILSRYCELYLHQMLMLDAVNCLVKERDKNGIPVIR